MNKKLVNNGLHKKIIIIGIVLPYSRLIVYPDCKGTGV